MLIMSQKLATYFSHHRFRKLLLSFGDLFFMLFGSKVVLFDLLFCTKKGKKRKLLKWAWYNYIKEVFNLVK